VLKDLERALARALFAEDPVAALRRESESLPDADRERCRRVDADGFRLTGLLVIKLRFERTCRGDVRLERWFRRSPREFTEAFRAYAKEVAPTAYFPRREAAEFRAWCATNGRLPPDEA
jgi:hypothetical protein